MGQMHKFKRTYTHCEGFRVTEGGEVRDFEFDTPKRLTSLTRASALARRKFGDASITIVALNPVSKSYVVDIDKLMEIAEEQ